MKNIYKFGFVLIVILLVANIATAFNTKKADEPKYLTRLEITVMDSMEEYESFAVGVDENVVYYYYSEGLDYRWITHNIDLTPYNIILNESHVVQIICIANDTWEEFYPYGQCAVDDIKLISGQKIVSYIDIGNPISERYYNIVGFGPIEPDTHGGEIWGDVDNCRCVWTPGMGRWAYADMNIETKSNILQQ